MSTYNEEELELVAHALGAPKMYRNRFVCAEDHAAWKGLQERGLAAYWHIEWCGSGGVWMVTAKGQQLFREQYFPPKDDHEARVDFWMGHRCWSAAMIDASLADSTTGAFVQRDRVLAQLRGIEEMLDPICHYLAAQLVFSAEDVADMLVWSRRSVRLLLPRRLNPARVEWIEDCLDAVHRELAKWLRVQLNDQGGMR